MEENTLTRVRDRETSTVRASEIRWLSDADIVPDEVQSELIQIGDFLTEGAFRIGDIANELISRVAQSGWQVTNDRVYAAVGRFCGKSGRTVRYYAETSAFYPQDARQEFHTAPFSHFVFARGTGCKWREALEYSAVTPGVTVQELTSQFIMVDKLMKSNAVARDSAAGLESEDGANTVGDAIRREIREVSHDNLVADDISLGIAVGDLITALDRAVCVLSKIELDKSDKLNRLLIQSINGCTELRGVIGNLSKTLWE